MTSTRALPLVATLVVALAPAARAQQPTRSELIDDATRAYGAKDYKRAAELFRQGVARAAKSADPAYNGACASALAGDREGAFALLETSLARGFRDVDNLRTDPDLAALHDDPRWGKVVAAAEAGAAEYRKKHGSPDGARFITSDVDLFWRVYPKLAGAPDPAALLETEYLDAGTVGLQDFVQGRIRSGKNLYDTIRTHPRYYAAIRGRMSRMAVAEREVRKSFRTFKALYDEATFPDVYFVVGALSSGGTSSSHGLILGAEMLAAGPDVPTDELDDWQRGAVHSDGDLPNIIAHELMHFQQRHRPSTLLAKAFHEGSADFLASLVSKGTFNRRAYDYGYAHEAELWKQFRTEMNGQDISGWLYGSSLRDGRPVDLGYFMGFRIAQAYYDRAADKKQAIRDILTSNDFEKLLLDSRYGESFK